MDNPSKKVRVYYDGLCVVCSKEIDHYRKQAGSDKIEFVDICASSFDPHVEALDPFLVHKVMHARDSAGDLKTGIESFILIWEQLPRYQWAARWARRRGVREILNVGYHGFTFLRPYLPRKKQDCESSPYCDVRSGEKF